MKLCGDQFCGGVALALCLLAPPVNAFAQENAPLARVRVAIVTQPDSGALRLGEAIRTVLGQSPVASALKIITMQDVLRIVDEAYRSPDAPIAFSDMREVAKLLRADVLVGLTPDSARGQAAVVGTLAAPIRGKQRVIGTWLRGDPVELAKVIVRAIEADSLFMRAIAQH